MEWTVRRMAAVTAGAALLMAPAVGQAHHRAGHTNGGGQPESQPQPPSPSPSKSQRCKRPATKVGFVVNGTLTSFTADDSATPANEGSVSITVTGGNSHARKSGDANGTFTATGSSDPFTVVLEGFEAGETPAAGDKVTIVGKVARTRAKCAPSGTSVADRYGEVNVRKVVIHDAD